MSGIWCMDCHARLEGDEPCPCCTRSYAPAGAPAARTAEVRWLCVLTKRGLVVVRLTGTVACGGVPTIDLREVT